MTEDIAVAIISFLSAALGASAVFFLGLKKYKPEVRNLDSESSEHSASAAESALRTTERATQQLYATMKDLDTERTKRRELQKTVDDLRDQLELQKIDNEEKLRHQKAEYDRKFDIMRGNMAALANQVVQLGGTPIKLMGE